MFASNRLLKLAIGPILLAGAVLGDTVLPGSQVSNPGDFFFTIFEGIQYTLPATVVAGDVVLCEDGNAATLGTACVASDIVHFFNNLRDNGNGTGFGNLVEEYTPANDLGDANDVLFPFAKLSSNAFAINEKVNEDLGEVTQLISGGNTYAIISDVPEPSELVPLMAGLGALLAFRRIRRI